MARLQRIEAEVAALPEEELHRFRAWFDDFYAKRWDEELEADVSAGKLDSVAAEALAEYHAGKCKRL